MGYRAARATERTPCPISHVDARRAWLKFGLTVVGCAIGGLGLGVLLAAVIGRRLWETVTAVTGGVKYEVVALEVLHPTTEHG